MLSTHLTKVKHYVITLVKKTRLLSSTQSTQLANTAIRAISLLPLVFLCVTVAGRGFTFLLLKSGADSKDIKKRMVFLYNF
jgi:hypothetical protein